LFLNDQFFKGGESRFYKGGIMICVKTKIFKSNRSQAVRFPKDVSFPESVKDVEIIKLGNKRIIVPADQSWDDWFDGPEVSDDFMNQRQQS
jgi:antitoxin VapB